MFIEKQNTEQRRQEELNRERQEQYEELKAVKIEDKINDLRISLEWASILINSGEDSYKRRDTKLDSSAATLSGFQLIKPREHKCFD